MRDRVTLFALNHDLLIESDFASFAFAISSQFVVVVDISHIFVHAILLLKQLLKLLIEK